MNTEKNTEVMLKAIFDISISDNENATAKAFGIKGTAIEEMQSTMIGEDLDIYDLIETINKDKVQHNYDFVSFLTTGWAAPLNKDGEVEGAPSKHKDRRRVTLIAVININDKDTLGSVLKFDDDDELVFDEGKAVGSLNDAILSLVKK